MFESIKVAIVHHWLLSMRGGERVLEAMLELFPRAEIFTLFYRPQNVSETIRSRPVHASVLNRLPGAHRFYQSLLPLFPAACQRFDLSGFQLVITSDASVVKCVRPARTALHVCYCYSPPRYLWEMSELYLAHAGMARRAGAALFTPWLKKCDYRAAQEAHHLVAISEHVKSRIHRYYQRDSTVIYPPVRSFEPAPGRKIKDYYLYLGQLVPYKRADLAVLALSRMKRRLLVIGEGADRPRLERLAGPDVEFLGWQPDDRVREYLASCRALIFPGEEDFGLVPLEAQMAGRPVIALGRGGALETVVDGKTGRFFASPDPESLMDAVRGFEAMEMSFDPGEIRKNALRFEKQRFLQSFQDFIREKMEERSKQV